MQRRRFLATACAGILAPGLAPGRGLAPAAEGSQPADVDSMLESIRKAHDLPALAGAVIKEGRTAAAGAVGVRKYGDKTPVTLNDQFHLGSCTKSMTATLAGMFIEEGKLRWDSTLAETLPAMAAKMHPDLRAVTLEQLLQHRSGQTEDSDPAAGPLWKLIDEKKLPNEPRQQRAAYAEMILAEEPASKPGSTYEYSNRNYALAGVILESIADKPWEELITERLFRPLGMKTAGFGAMGTPGKIDQPWQHQMAFFGLVRLPVEPGPKADNPPAIGPGATVHCSIGDWTKYLRCHVRPKGDGALPKGNLLKPETYRRLHTPSFGGNYAGGWRVLHRAWAGGRVLTHSGSNTMNFAVAWLAPLRDCAVLAMTNQGGPQAAEACDEVCSGLIVKFLKP